MCCETCAVFRVSGKLVHVMYASSLTPPDPTDTGHVFKNSKVFICHYSQGWPQSCAGRLKGADPAAVDLHANLAQQLSNCSLAYFAALGDGWQLGS
mmetsp:Transcript_51565/g.92643  ORF Transcript_51565/g.92643 Transcript_51565/m.92643 type:complete len:96 (+) Transcript_51565:20-307(+)